MRVFSWLSTLVLVGLSALVCLANPPHVVEIVEKMPIVQGGYGELVAASRPPIEQRGPEFRKFLAPSVKIAVSGGSGSGTICYYDPVKNLAYVATCGHLWDRGVMTVQEGQRRNIKCKVILFYHNDMKLSSPKEYDSKVIFYSHVNGCDTGLVTFQPDFIPDYFPLAPPDFVPKSGSHQHSLGCDGGSEVAHYDVEIIGIEGANLLTRYNSPRPGRSGGGLLNDEGFYIGTCWGTSVRDGTGVGYFTPISVIHGFWKQQEGYSFLLEQQPGGNFPARSIPIIDRNGPAGTYPKDYIPLPHR